MLRMVLLSMVTLWPPTIHPTGLSRNMVLLSKATLLHPNMHPAGLSQSYTWSCFQRPHCSLPICTLIVSVKVVHYPTFEGHTVSSYNSTCRSRSKLHMVFLSKATLWSPTLALHGYQSRHGPIIHGHTLASPCAPYGPSPSYTLSFFPRPHCSFLHCTHQV